MSDKLTRTQLLSSQAGVGAGHMYNPYTAKELRHLKKSPALKHAAKKCEAVRLWKYEPGPKQRAKLPYVRHKTREILREHTAVINRCAPRPSAVQGNRLRQLSVAGLQLLWTVQVPFSGELAVLANIPDAPVSRLVEDYIAHEEGLPMAAQLVQVALCNALGVSPFETTKNMRTNRAYLTGPLPAVRYVPGEFTPLIESILRGLRASAQAVDVPQNDTALLTRVAAMTHGLYGHTIPGNTPYTWSWTSDETVIAACEVKDHLMQRKQRKEAALREKHGSRALPCRDYDRKRALSVVEGIAPHPTQIPPRALAV